MRIQSIDTFKGLAILSVVVIHTEPFLTIQAIKADWYYLGHALQQISSFAVPFFFITAGYLFSQGIEKEGLSYRWWQYTTRLSKLLLIWIIIDGIFWGQWLEQIIHAKNLSPLLWNLCAIPSFAFKRPDLFLFRGTSVSLWFLISLIISVSLLAFFIKLSLRPTTLLVIGCCMYTFSLITSYYSDTPLTIGLSLPLEQRGPFIAFAFLTIGHYFAVRGIAVRCGPPILAATVLLVFAESAVLAHFAGEIFHEMPYLFSTVLLAGGAFLYAIQNPTFGATSILPKIGNRSLGIYLVHAPVLGAANLMRGFVVHPIWELMFPLLVLGFSYSIVVMLMKIPYARAAVL